MPWCECAGWMSGVVGLCGCAWLLDVQSWADRTTARDPSRARRAHPMHPRPRPLPQLYSFFFPWLMMNWLLGITSLARSPILSLALSQCPFSISLINSSRCAAASSQISKGLSVRPAAACSHRHSSRQCSPFSFFAMVSFLIRKLKLRQCGHMIVCMAAEGHISCC